VEYQLLDSYSARKIGKLKSQHLHFGAAVRIFHGFFPGDGFGEAGDDNDGADVGRPDEAGSGDPAGEPDAPG
jgi:hypothetical protein